MYHSVAALDPERLHVFRTVKEITGEFSVIIIMVLLLCFRFVVFLIYCCVFTSATLIRFLFIFCFFVVFLGLCVFFILMFLCNCVFVFLVYFFGFPVALLVLELCF